MLNHQFVWWSLPNATSCIISTLSQGYGIDLACHELHTFAAHLKIIPLMNKFVSFAKFALLFAGCAFVVSSCTEEDEDPSIIGSWVFTDAVFNPAVMIDSVMVTDAYNLFFSDACDQDNLIIIQDGGIQISDQGVLLCDSTALQQVTGSYTYEGSTFIAIETSTGDTTFVITNVAITSTTMTGSISTEFNDESTNVDVTLTRQ